MQFDRLVRQHKDAVYRQMVRMCGNQEDAEDVLAEALMKAYRAMDQLGDEASFQAWLAIIARRTCGRLKRREMLHPILHLADLAASGTEPPSQEQTPELQAIEAETKACLLFVLAQLPDLYREVYDLREVQGLSAQETADHLGISVAAVKSRLHRARAQVRAGIDVGLSCG